MLDPNTVIAWDAGATSYPETAPFHPEESYPEYPFGSDGVGSPNPVYKAVRDMLHHAGMDEAAYGTPAWNPLGELVQPGNTVVLKPNLVISEHPDGQAGIEAAIVHGSVLRPLIDYVYIALKGSGRIIVADSPIKEVEFERVLELTGIAGLKRFYDDASPLGLETLDFRDRYVERDHEHGNFMGEMTVLAGDPQGYTQVDLGSSSMFHDIDQHHDRLRSTAVYYENVMDDFHSGGHHIYSIPNTLLQADVVISVTKLKTHRKGGVTLSLKNAVGITNEKRSLPHHRVGSPKDGGDAVADNVRLDALLEDRFRDFMLSRPGGRTGLRLLGSPLRLMATRVVKPLFRRLSPNSPAIVEGDWYGNDTVWRMALDLNRVLLYTDKDGVLRDQPQRRYFSVIDGIIAGEGEGPLFPTPKPCGALLMGLHPVLVDLVGSRLMGFDWRRIPMLREALARQWPLPVATEPSKIDIKSNLSSWQRVFATEDTLFAFQPSAGWQGHIEL